MNLAEFSKHRMSGLLNSDIVEIWMDDEFEGWRDNQIIISASKKLTQLECRLFYGLNVFLHTEHYSETVVKNFEGLQNHVLYVMTAITDFSEDLGFEWRKQ